MTQNEINKNNKMLAEFIRATANVHNTYEMYGIIPSIEDGEDERHLFYLDEMLFSSSWDWIMEVVQKIESITVDNEHQYEVHIHGCDCRIVNRQGKVVAEYENELSKIDAVYFACVDFVKWYNENK